MYCDQESPRFQKLSAIGAMVFPTLGTFTQALFGTAEPTRKQLETVLTSVDEFQKLEDPVKVASMQFRDQIDRGNGHYIVLYDKAEPREIFSLVILLIEGRPCRGGRSSPPSRLSLRKPDISLPG